MQNQKLRGKLAIGIIISVLAGASFRESEQYKWIYYACLFVGLVFAAAVLISLFKDGVTQNRSRLLLLLGGIISVVAVFLYSYLK